MYLSYYQKKKLDAATIQAKKRLFGESDNSILCSTTRNPPTSGDLKGFSSTYKSRQRRTNALKEQHSLRPFTHKADLLLDEPIDEKKFRRKLSDLNKGRFDIVWQQEVCRSQSHPHYHPVIRTTESIETFRQYISDCLSPRKGQPPKISYKLNVEEIDPDRSDALFDYNSKSTPRLLTKIAPETKGQRTLFTTGKPFDAPARELHRQRWHRERELAIYCSDPDYLEDIVTFWEDQILALNPKIDEPLDSDYQEPYNDSVIDTITTTNTEDTTMKKLSDYPLVAREQAIESWAALQRFLATEGPEWHGIAWLDEAGEGVHLHASGGSISGPTDHDTATPYLFSGWAKNWPEGQLEKWIEETTTHLRDPEVYLTPDDPIYQEHVRACEIIQAHKNFRTMNTTLV